MSRLNKRQTDFLGWTDKDDPNDVISLDQFGDIRFRKETTTSTERTINEDCIEITHITQWMQLDDKLQEWVPKRKTEKQLRNPNLDPWIDHVVKRAIARQKSK